MENKPTTENSNKSDWKEAIKNKPFEPTLTTEKQVSKILKGDFYSPEEKDMMMYLMFPNGGHIYKTRDKKDFNKLPIITYHNQHVVLFCLVELMWRTSVSLYKLKEIAELVLKTMDAIDGLKDEKKGKEKWMKCLDYVMKNWKLNKSTASLIIKTINLAGREFLK